jgi:hypothetical protein
MGCIPDQQHLPVCVLRQLQEKAACPLLDRPP